MCLSNLHHLITPYFYWAPRSVRNIFRFFRQKMTLNAQDSPVDE